MGLPHYKISIFVYSSRFYVNPTLRKPVSVSLAGFRQVRWQPSPRGCEWASLRAAARAADRFLPYWQWITACVWMNCSGWECWVDTERPRPHHISSGRERPTASSLHKYSAAAVCLVRSFRSANLRFFMTNYLMMMWWAYLHLDWSISYSWAHPHLLGGACIHL